MENYVCVEHVETSGHYSLIILCNSCVQHLQCSNWRMWAFSMQLLLCCYRKDLGVTFGILWGSGTNYPETLRDSFVYRIKNKDLTKNIFNHTLELDFGLLFRIHDLCDLILD